MKKITITGNIGDNAFNGRHEELEVFNFTKVNSTIGDGFCKNGCNTQVYMDLGNVLSIGKDFLKSGGANVAAINLTSIERIDSMCNDADDMNCESL